MHNGMGMAARAPWWPRALVVVGLTAVGCVKPRDAADLPQVGRVCEPVAGSGDRDCDGLDDALEVRIVRDHAPWFRFAGSQDGEGELDDPWQANGSDSECDDFGCLHGCDDPRDHLLADLGVPRPWSQVRRNGAWPFQPYLRTPAPVRVTPGHAFPLLHVAYAKETGDPNGLGEPWGWYTDPQCGDEQAGLASTTGASALVLAAAQVGCAGDPDSRWIDDQPRNQGYLIVRLSLAFAADGGRRIAGIVTSEHLGDSEALTMTLVRDAKCDEPRTPLGDGYRVVEIATGAHFNDANNLEAIHRYRIPERAGCTWGARYVDPATLRSSDRSLTWRDSVIWVNARKHGLYGTVADCNAGGGGYDDCEFAGYFQTIDPIDIGEPGPNIVVRGLATEDGARGGHIDADDPEVNPVDARAIPLKWGTEQGLFPGEADPWAAQIGGFSGGFRSERLYGECATDPGQLHDYWMKDPFIHKYIGDVSPLTGHTMLACFPGGGLQPPHIAAVSPDTLPPEGGTVVLDGQFPLLEDIESVMLGDALQATDVTALATDTRRDCDGTVSAYATRLSFTAPRRDGTSRPYAFPIVITRRPYGEDGARVRTLETIRGTVGSLTY